MIIQEINLYQDRFKEKKILLSALHLLLLSGLLIVILAVSSYWYKSQFRQAESYNKNLLNDKQQSTQVLDTHKNKLQKILADNRIDSELSKLSLDIAARKKIINFVSNNQLGSGEGFYSHLHGLSEINIKNVWLNEISLAENYLKLSGSALKAAKIPEYFSLFQQRELFNGNQFEVFQLDRVQKEDWKVDFMIASRVAGNE